MDDPTKPVASGAALETVVIFTNRMEFLAGFYQSGFGLSDFQRSPGHLGLQVGPVYLGFDQVDDQTAAGAVSLWFTVDDLQESFEKLVGQGARVRYPPSRKPWGGFLASLYDPDGNTIGLSQRNTGN